MLFRRRESVRLKERLRVLVWPRRNWERSTRYILHRLRRLRSTPHAIALGCGAGVLVSFTPFLGLHFVTAAVLAWLTRASIIASAFGTFIGNPLTFPFIWIASYKLGNWVLGEEPVRRTIDLSSGMFQHPFEQLWPLIKPMTVGGVPLGLLAAAIVYFPIRKAVETYQEKRRRIRSLRGQPVQA